MRGILALLDGDEVGPVNIGNPGEFTVRELAELVLEVTGSRSEIVHEPLPVDDPTQRRPDITLPASRWVGAAVALREGLERTAPWFREALGMDMSELRAKPERRRADRSQQWRGGQRTALSVLVPVYNERNTVAEIVRRMRHVDLPLDREIIIIDDGSDDGTDKVLAPSRTPPFASSVTRRTAARARPSAPGSAPARGDIVARAGRRPRVRPGGLAQAAAPMLNGRALVVYGSRFTGERRNMVFWTGSATGCSRSSTNVLYNTTLSDMETCYKLFDRRVLDGIEIDADRFDFEPEITAKLLRAGHRIYEVPISYAGREADEGKKITWQRWLHAPSPPSCGTGSRGDRRG